MKYILIIISFVLGITSSIIYVNQKSIDSSTTPEDQGSYKIESNPLIYPNAFFKFGLINEKSKLTVKVAGNKTTSDSRIAYNLKHSALLHIDKKTHNVYLSYDVYPGLALFGINETNPNSKSADLYAIQYVDINKQVIRKAIYYTGGTITMSLSELTEVTITDKPN